MRKHIWISIVLLAGSLLLALFLVKSNDPGDKFPFRFGLDLVGGTELVFDADTSGVDDVDGAMQSLKEVIERRINVFGVSEPLVQTESAGLVSGNRSERLIVGLPGITDLDQAVELIGKTPSLEFRLLDQEAATSTQNLAEGESLELGVEDLFISTGLTGQYLERARVEFNPTTGEPVVSLQFNEEGSELFATITREHQGEILAIILDNAVLSTPVIQDEITGGQAQITGQFSPEEAKTLVRDLNYGALPVPIALATSQTVGATLGNVALDSAVEAGLWGFLVLSVFLIVWYRLPGLVAVVALAIYTVISLTLFKLIPVTLTAAGLAGFILSVGMAVDANVLIFERTKEELRKGRGIRDSIEEGFKRAWSSIRDSNISSIITAVVLFWIGTSAVKGFALTLGVGVLVSMFTAVTVSRTFLLGLAPEKGGKKSLFTSGLN